MLRICGLAGAVALGWRTRRSRRIDAGVTKLSASEGAMFIARSPVSRSKQRMRVSVVVVFLWILPVGASGESGRETRWREVRVGPADPAELTC